MSKAAELAALIGSQTALSNRNLVINGAMQVWQRATSNSSVTSNSYPAVDRWKFWANGSTMGTTRTAFTLGQTAVPSIKYYNSIDIASNSGAGHYHTINHHVEDVTKFDGVKVTLSFYAKASVAWTVGIEPIQNFGSGGSPSSRVLGTAQTVSVGTSWERHKVTISLASLSGKTLGTTANTSNFEIAMWLSGGSDFNARTGSIGNQSGTIDITGVQLEVGEQATPFEHRSFGDELLRCQRYFYSHVSGNEETIANAAAYSSTQVFGTLHFPVSMRITPSLAAANGTNYYRFYRNGSNTDFDEFGFNDRSKNSMTIYKAGLSGLTAGHSGWFVTNNASASLTFDSEL